MTHKSSKDRVVCKLESENKAGKHLCIPIGSIELGLTGDSDGDAFEDGVKAEGGDEQNAVAQGVRVVQHRCNRVIGSMCLLQHNTNQATIKIIRLCTVLGSGHGLTWSHNEFRN